MVKYIKTDKLQDNLFVPVKLSDQIIRGTLPHTIEYLVDNKIDITIFENKIKNDETGSPAYNPRVLLKLVFYAYANGIISSRKIHALAKENLVAMALAENTAPDFTVIAAFVSGMKDEISSVFENILLVAEEMNLLGNTVFALDGCKLPSNAGRENSGTFDDLRKKQEKFKKKIEFITKSQEEEEKKRNRT